MGSPQSCQFTVTLKSKVFARPFKAYIIPYQSSLRGGTVKFCVSAAAEVCELMLDESGYLLEDNDDSERMTSRVSVNQNFQLPDAQSNSLEPIKCQTHEEFLQKLNSHKQYHGFAGATCSQTLDSIVDMVCNNSAGGALVAVATQASFENLLKTKRLHLRVTDSGYMTDRLRGLHVDDPVFQRAFNEFTEHTDDDRWPNNHTDALARGKPKDGALLFHTSGHRLKAATKLLGLPPVCTWANMGTKHEAAASLAWYCTDSFVLVKSDSGGIHGLVKNGDELLCYEHPKDAVHSTSHSGAAFGSMISVGDDPKVPAHW